MRIEQLTAAPRGIYDYQSVSAAKIRIIFEPTKHFGNYFPIILLQHYSLFLEPRVLTPFDILEEDICVLITKCLFKILSSQHSVLLNVISFYIHAGQNKST